MAVRKTLHIRMLRTYSYVHTLKDKYLIQSMPLRPVHGLLRDHIICDMFFIK